MELWLQGIVALSSAVTALAAVGAFDYIRKTSRDAGKAVRLLEGTEAAPGIIARVEDVEEQTEQNTHAAARHRRALSREGLLNPDSKLQDVD